MKFKFPAITAVLVAAMAESAVAAQINTFDKLVIAADDNSFSARLTGRLHVDGNFYKSGSDTRRLPSGTFVRRARIGVQGNFREWEYAVEFDNATNEASLKEAELRRWMGPGKIAIGQFKVFESMERLNNSNEITFIERPWICDIVPGFKIGVGYGGTAGMIGYAGNVYNMREADDGEARPVNSGSGVAGRFYVSPVHQKTAALHFGVSYAQEHSDTQGVLTRVIPLGRAEKYESNTDDEEDAEDFRFVVFDREDHHVQINRVNMEAATVNGPLTFQAEYLLGKAQANGRADDDFYAWYAQISYILTGETREYGFREGIINRPKPSRQVGAFEIAGRYQQTERTKVSNAELNATELGLTYYANNNVRFMVNYGWADNKLINDKPRLLSARAQFDF